MVTKGIIVLLLAVILTLACSSAGSNFQPVGEDSSVSTTTATEEPERYVLQQPLDFTMTLTTTSIGGTFGRLDRKHTCEKGDISPHLKWEGIPDGTKSLALVMDDPASDVHGFSVDILWTHWVVYSIPPEVTELAVGQVSGELLENGAKQGANDYERVKYSGPCPIPTLSFLGRSYTSQVGIGPPGQSTTAEDRQYYFRLYALDFRTDLISGLNRDTLLRSIDGHIIAAGELSVAYKSTKKQTCQTTNPEVCLSSVRR